MAEIRKFDPSTGEGLQKLVREAIGETVRPNPPGGQPKPAAPDSDEPTDAASAPASAAALPDYTAWLSPGPQ